VAVQEDEKSKEGSDGNKEEGATEEDVEEISDNDYDGFAFTQKSYVLCKTMQAYQADGFCSIANQLLTYSVTQNYWAISTMRKVH
jgi:hypothetical protein